jgi:hypothetical protein
MRRMDRSERDLEIQPARVKQLARLQETVPAEKFALWKQRHRRQRTGPSTVSSDYPWSVTRFLITHKAIIKILDTY